MIKLKLIPDEIYFICDKEDPYCKWDEIIYKFRDTEMISEGKLLNSTLAGLTGLALTGGTVLGLNELSKQNQDFDDVPVKQLTVVKQAKDDKKPVPEPKIPRIDTTDWMSSITAPFIIKWEGKITDRSGNHVLYDDDVNRTVKRRWNGKGGAAGIERFIKSCIGTPTIGYGCTDKNIIRKGLLSESEAKADLLKKIENLNIILWKRHPEIWKRLTALQRTALISFYYNLGTWFEAPKMVANLTAGNLSGAAHEFLDCNNVTTKTGKKVKVNGLTRRRAAEAALLAK